MWKEKYIEKYGEDKAMIPFYFRIGLDEEKLFEKCIKQDKTWEEILDIKNKIY